MSLPIRTLSNRLPVMSAQGAASVCCSAVAFSPPPVLQRQCSLTPAPTASRRPRADDGAAAAVIAPRRRRRRAALVAVVAGPEGKQRPEAVASAASVEADAGAPSQPVPSLVTGTPDARPAAVPAGAEHDTLPAPVKWVNGAAVGLAVAMTDWIFAGKEPVRRFWVLEVVARCPYFSYVWGACRTKDVVEGMVVRLLRVVRRVAGMCERQGMPPRPACLIAVGCRAGYVWPRSMGLTFGPFIFLVV